MRQTTSSRNCTQFSPELDKSDSICFDSDNVGKISCSQPDLCLESRDACMRGRLETEDVNQLKNRVEHYLHMLFNGFGSRLVHCGQTKLHLSQAESSKFSI